MLQNEFHIVIIHGAPTHRATALILLRERIQLVINSGAAPALLVSTATVQYARTYCTYGDPLPSDAG